MSITFYQASIPVFAQMMKNISEILKKAETHAEVKKIDPLVLTGARLYPDMAPLTRQIQIMSDAAKGFAARAAGVENPSFPDTETTFAELQARLAKTQDFLASIKPEQIDGQEGRDVTLKLGGNDVTFKAQLFLLRMALPNFFFHATTSYDILRHNGVEIGKLDYLGGF